jgi:hypothetical protein
MSKISRGGLRPPEALATVSNIAARFICSAGLQPGIFLFFGIRRHAAPATGAWPRPEYRRKPTFCSAGVLAGSFRSTIAPRRHTFSPAVRLTPKRSLLIYVAAALLR